MTDKLNDHIDVTIRSAWDLYEALRNVPEAVLKQSKILTVTYSDDVEAGTAEVSLFDVTPLNMTESDIEQNEIGTFLEIVGSTNDL